MTFILTNSQMIIKTTTRLPVYYLATRTNIVTSFPNAVSIWKFKSLELLYSNFRLISTNACKFESISDKGNVIRNYSGKSEVEESGKHVTNDEPKFKGTYLHEQSPYYQRVAKITNKILAHNNDIPEIVNKSWPIFVGKFDMAREEGWDACATQDGHIYVNSDFFVKVKNDDDLLAFIVAHEISHICLNHLAEHTSEDIAEKQNRLSFELLTSMMLCVSTWIFIRISGIPKLTIMPFILIFGMCLGRYVRVKTMKSPLPSEETTRTTKIQEFEADEFGLRLVSKAGFDFRQAVLFYQKRKENQSTNAKMSIPGYPKPEENLINLIDLLPKAHDLRTSCGWPELSKSDETAEKLQTIINAIEQYTGSK